MRTGCSATDRAPRTVGGRSVADHPGGRTPTCRVRTAIGNTSVRRSTQAGSSGSSSRRTTARSSAPRWGASSVAADARWRRTIRRPTSSNGIVRSTTKLRAATSTSPGPAQGLGPAVGQGDAAQAVAQLDEPAGPGLVEPRLEAGPTDADLVGQAAHSKPALDEGEPAPRGEQRDEPVHPRLLVGKVVHDPAGPHQLDRAGWHAWRTHVADREADATADPRVRRPAPDRNHQAGIDVEGGHTPRRAQSRGESTGGTPGPAAHVDGRTRPLPLDDPGHRRRG